MKPDYLDMLKDFVEGKKSLKDWPAWWQENELIIEETEGRTRYLKIKLYWQEGACQILDHYGISYKSDETINWSRCKECGEPLFSVMPHKTTKEQIRKFARSSNLPNKEEIEKDEWMHPGVYCSNGCTCVWLNIQEEVE